jgi:hypothetical protein
MYNYKQILDWKYNGCNFTISDPLDYSTLVWTDSSEKPSQEMLETKIELIKASELNSVRQKRANEYPSIQDQLDILYHGGYDAWKAVIQAIKDKYPKPL